MEPIDAGTVDPAPLQTPDWFGKMTPKQRAVKVFAAMPRKPNVHTLSPASLAKLAKHGDNTEETDMSKKVTLEDLAKMAEAGDAAHSILAKAEDQVRVKFEQRINEIAKRDNCNQREAAEKARDEHPEEFEAWQTGALSVG